MRALGVAACLLPVIAAAQTPPLALEAPQGRPDAGAGALPAIEGLMPPAAAEGAPASEARAAPAAAEGAPASEALTAPAAVEGAPVIEEFAPPFASPGAPSAIESFEAAPAGPVTQVFGSLRGLAGFDTRLDSALGDPDAEDITAYRVRANLGVDVKLSDRVRVVAEGRLRWHGAAQRGLSRARAELEPTVGDAFVDLYTRKVDLRIGNQIVAFGANAAFAPADALNARDLRDGLLSGEPEDAKLPAFAFRALGDIGKVTVTAAYFPFFTPNRFDVFGQDEALLQPGLGMSLPRRLDRSVEELAQARLLETQRPAAFGTLGDLGLRLVTPAGRAKVGASWLWVNEKLPQVRLDPELQYALAANALGRELDAATTLSLQNRLAAGEQLFTGTYGRQHVLSAEASVLVGPSQLDLDLSYTPRQSFVDADFAPVAKAAVTWVLGVSQAEDSPYLYSLIYLGMAVPEVDAEQMLFVIEPATAQGAARTAWLHLLVGSAGVKLWDDRLELSVRGVFEPIQRSFAIAPRVEYLGLAGARLWLGAELYEGPAFSPLGYYGRNDQVLVGAQLDLF